MPHFYKSWWPGKPQGSVILLHLAESICVLAVIAGVLVALSGGQQLLPGLVIIAGNFVFFSLVRAARYILELLIWQRENAQDDRLKASVES